MPVMEESRSIMTLDGSLQLESGALTPNRLDLSLVASMAGNVTLPSQSPVIQVDEKGLEEVRQALQSCAGQ